MSAVSARPYGVVTQEWGGTPPYRKFACGLLAPVSNRNRVCPGHPAVPDLQGGGQGTSQRMPGRSCR